MLINPYVFGGYDANAQAYITAVETADGQALEIGVKNAITAFVVGCKADGIWTAIKASCILAGARTLTGALVPLVGTAPTNINFASIDYSRKTGLVGNASNKRLNANRSMSADAQNDFHMSAFATASGFNSGFEGFLIGANGLDVYRMISTTSGGNGRFQTGNAGGGFYDVTLSGVPSGLYGITRSSAASATVRVNATNYTTSVNSTSLSSENYFVYARNNVGFDAGYTNARLGFYSLGNSLDLAKLDTRVTTLINALAAAIP